MIGTGPQRAYGPPQRLINLTPHDVVLDLGAGEQLRIPASGIVPRLVLSKGRLEALHVVDPSSPELIPSVPCRSLRARYFTTSILLSPIPSRVRCTSRAVHLPST